mmetsp:Transcript_78429/g.196991  ORF Transcript_78429/g.196991 Transcript_78429/m.196991 type:complete len:323 (+) Transcript_78429:85-1053(+)|eukprot:CAMPEP_0115703740 /NCGR_PEP_ID=MMETSP0272-20121206/69268_1 /TAXON_ID=71861 /ORGANISM="Scrippsiella trochoidea, Strain CCMP3099" /LENGTH=322 /DNA_ID=CAMNT_0003144641 /DNA_START=10 /DNA_END=978 /DNA_ORIENTATION=+
MKGSARHRHLVKDHCMDGGGTIKVKASTVLATSHDLNSAIHASTKGGTRRIDGLYAPDGSKVDAHADKQRGDEASTSGNAHAAANEKMAKVAARYQHNLNKKRRHAAHANQTEEEADDEESAKKAETILANSTENEQMQYRELFNFFDVDKDRTWGSIEFAQRMTDIGCATTVENASNLLYFAGVRDVDRITYNDFVQLMPKLKAFRKLLEKDAMREFAAKDTHGRGFITPKALREILHTMSGDEGMSKEHMDKIVKTADRERTGMITFEMFIRAIFGTPPLLVYKPKGRAASLLGAICFCGKPGKGDDSDEDLDEDGMPKL